MTASSIYDDLNNIDLGERVLKLQQQNDKLHNHILSLEKDVQKLCHELVEMKKVEENLKRNISELYKTAKNEIDRKDRMICELRRELDDVLFRRRTNTSVVANSLQNNFGDTKINKRNKIEEPLDYEKKFKRVKREYSDSDDKSKNDDTKNLNYKRIKKETNESSQICNGVKSTNSNVGKHEYKEERRSRDYNRSRSNSREHDRNRRRSNSRNNYKRSQSRDSKRGRTRSKERESNHSKNRNKDCREDLRVIATMNNSEDYRRSNNKQEDFRMKINKQFDQLTNSDKKSSKCDNNKSDSKDKTEQIKAEKDESTKIKQEKIEIRNSSKQPTTTIHANNIEKDIKHTNGLDQHSSTVVSLNNKENETQPQDKTVIVQSVVKEEQSSEKGQLDKSNDISQPCPNKDSLKLEKSPNTIKLNARRRRCVIKIVN